LAQLDGVLNVSLLNGFSPAAGDIFEILTATGGVTGTFSSLSLPLLENGLMWELVYSLNDLTLQVVRSMATLAADFDENGVVDSADLAAWTSNLGTAVGATHAQGDANADGAVDGADFLVWQQQVEGPSAMSDSAAIAEPHAWGFIPPLAAFLAANRRKLLA
jgi:hypothetical protein